MSVGVFDKMKKKKTYPEAKRSLAEFQAQMNTMNTSDLPKGQVIGGVPGADEHNEHLRLTQRPGHWWRSRRR